MALDMHERSSMKLPAHVLGLLVVGLAAPLVGGCGGEVEDNDPSETQTAPLARENDPDTEETQQQPTTQQPAPKAVAQQPARPAPTPREDPCPPCGMG